MTTPLRELVWPEADLPLAVEAACRAAGWSGSGAFLVPPALLPDPDSYIEAACARMGLDAEFVPLDAARFRLGLPGAAPALIHLPGIGYLVAVGGKGKRILLLDPASRRRAAAVADLLDAASREAGAEALQAIDRLLGQCGIAERRRGNARRRLLAERLGGKTIARLWRIRMPPSAGFSRQLRDAGLYRRAAAYAASHFTAFLLMIAAWALVGRGALDGRPDPGWMTAWALLLATMLPLRLLNVWSRGALAIGFGGLLKQRLLAGALKLEFEEVRCDGAGRHLGRVIESEMVESLAVSGGLAAALALVELAGAAFVLALGAAPLFHLPMLALAVALCLLQAVRFARRRAAWTERRMAITNDLVERMAGQRTRLAQQTPERRHDGEDEALAGYLDAAREMDLAAVRLSAILPRGWLVGGILGLAPAFHAASGPSSQATLAIAIGGILLAFRAFRRLVSGLAQLASAWIGWRQVAPLFAAAARPERTGAGIAEPNPTHVLEAAELSFRYPRRGTEALKGASLRVEPGDRILLEGASGGGKSTLGALLAGLREPDSGTLLASGLDRATLGDRAWRRRVAAAPQYHENHLISAPLLFNLLMARRWPPTQADIDEAEEICLELGLGPLLDRMPARLQQMVGETGWQLSQGERSRVFIARALLQQSGLVILDESFGALDPETLGVALECVLKRSRSLIAIAHP